MGALGGLVALRDRTPPAQSDLMRPAAARAPRVGVRLQRGRRRCIARVSGADRSQARKLSVLNSKARLIERDTRAPLRVRFRRRHRALRFVVTLNSGRRVLRIRSC